MNIIYHITKASYWEKLSATDSYETETLGVEGFIHCSTRDQVKGVLERYYAGQKDLYLLHIDPELLNADVKYEVGPNGDSFPHVYGKINKNAIIKVEAIDNH